MTLEVATYPVALDSRVEDITSLLDMSGGEGVTVVGIYGMGGIGKTTLAKAVFNKICCNFSGSSFLANVREVSGTVNGLVSLQQQLIDEILRNNIYTVHNVSQGTATIKERICSIKVLIIIDDLDNADQFESLVGLFISGSVIIVTTRNEDLLLTIGVEPRYRYRVDILSKAGSLQLFKQHAFGDKSPSDTFMDLSEQILQHAGGLPLALKIFGSNLRNQSKAEWKRFVGQLEEIQNPTVLKQFMISFDSLVGPTLKEMFLDIACFFVGEERKNVVRILGSCYKNVEPNIDHLTSRCLITFDERNRFLMHDLLRDMGWEIVRQNSPKDEPEKHSRLSVWEDIVDVLENNKGTEAIKGMVHHYSKVDESIIVTYDTETFIRMPKLRFLKMKDVNFTGSFEQIFKDLRWLHWSHCRLQAIPIDFCPRKLVILELPYSKITRWKLTKDLNNLKILDLSGSDKLITTPDFSRLPCLVTVNLAGCILVEKVDATIGSLVNLVSLDLFYCVRLRSLPDSVCNLRALESLNIGVCRSLESLPEELGNIESITKLVVGCREISKLPTSIGRLCKLVELRLDGNYILETLGETICDMRSLEILYIRRCRKLEVLVPYGINQMSNVQLPANLKQLTVIGCRSMRRLPNLSNLKHLEKLDLTKCSSLTEIEGLKELIFITELNLRKCESILRLPNLSNLKNLEKLDLTRCFSLMEIECLEELTSIRKLYLEGCYFMMLANLLTENLFQIYSECGNTVEIYVDKEDTPNWISHSGGRCTELHTNVSNNFLGILLYLACHGDLSSKYVVREGSVQRLLHRGTYSIINRGDGSTYEYDSDNFEIKEAMMVVVPRKDLIESCGGYDGDITLEITASCYLHSERDFRVGVHPLYKLP